MIELYQGDCLDVMREMDAGSVDAIITDPPYYKVKGEPWDRQWDTVEGFIEWLGEALAEFRRLLKPDGSLLLFASPKQAAKVELAIEKEFNVLNRIAWVKPFGEGWWKKADKSKLRRFFEQKEEIIFAEQYGADGAAMGAAGYTAKCDELRGFVFEPLRVYLDDERKRAGLDVQDVAEAWRIKTGNARRTGMAGHWFGRSQWALPTRSNYEWLRGTMARLNHGGEYLRREYEDLRREYEDLRREYEDLRREYEDLRRPFNVSVDVPYTDVWEFATVAHYPGKHPCEKPQDLLQHAITSTTRPGAVVLDAFAGSGAIAWAARATGRKCILIEKSPKWVAHIRTRQEARQLELAAP